MGNPGDDFYVSMYDHHHIQRAKALKYAVDHELVSPDLLKIPDPPFEVKRYASQEDCDALGTSVWSYWEFNEDACTCFYIDDIHMTDEQCDYDPNKPKANPLFYQYWDDRCIS